MLRRTDIARWCSTAAIAVTLLAGTAAASSSAASSDPASPDFVPTPHPMYKAGGVTIDEHLGARIPLDATFRTQDGATVTLRDVVAGELPTILTFNYADCPMLCNLQLNGLTAALPALWTPAEVAGLDERARPAAFRIGAQFRVVTIGLDPNESSERLAKMRDRYIERLPEAHRAAAREGWTFLAAATPGNDAAIRRVGKAVGFEYMYVPDRAEWAHPAALIFLSTTGTVTRYVHGIEYEPAMMRESIVKAGLAEPATAVGFMNRCYHFDPGANSHARAGVLALRLGAVGFLVLLVGVFGVRHAVRRGRGGAPSGGES